MLLAIDCGNTQLMAGVYDGKRLLGAWRISTDANRTEDEYAALFDGLFGIEGIRPEAIDSAAICSAVPAVVATLTRLCEKYLRVEPLIVDYQTPTGMPLLMDNPREVGPDRIVNGVAGYELYGGPLIVVDFGTATTFDCLSAAGSYLGGAIAPGMGTASEALFAKASRLSTVSLYKPQRAIGTNTADCLRSGIIWGFAGQVDGVVNKLREELPGARVVATGGLAELIAPYAVTIEAVDKELTLKGLKIIHDRITKGTKATGQK